MPLLPDAQDVRPSPLCKMQALGEESLACLLSLSFIRNEGAELLFPTFSFAPTPGVSPVADLAARR